MMPTQGGIPGETDVPLCIDLDGTLIRSDLLWESLFCFARQRFRQVFSIPLWFAKGRAHLKRNLAASIVLDLGLLPYNQPFIEWLRVQRARGRRMILCTAADELLARRVADHVGLFDQVMASDGNSNLKGRNKARLLAQRFGSDFDYAGNSAADWHIWLVCRQIIAVDTPGWLTRRLAKSGRLTETFLRAKPPASVWRRALRLHQWTKNVLIFVPIIAAHQALGPRAIPTLICFASFCLVASATYLVNDLFDLASDRQHPRKRHRPIAAGDLSIPVAVTACAALFAAGLALAFLSNTILVPLLILVYTMASLAYSFGLKKLALFDVYLLSGFYTLRIVIGGIAGKVPLSRWFLSFSVFLFLSLGFAKRSAELHRLPEGRVPGRGYIASDVQPVMCFGVAAAFAAALVLSLYLQSEEVQTLYSHPRLLWMLFPICLYWLTRIWLLASRGTLHDDPISFAISDRLTWVLIAICGFILRLAASKMPLG